MSAPYPDWIEITGIPQLLKGGNAWSIFRLLIQLDCQRNTIPGEIDITITDLAIRTGIDTTAATKAIKQIHRAGLIKMYLPETPEEPALFKIAQPLPVNPDRLAAIRGTATLRYIDDTKPTEPALEIQQAVADMYMTTCGLDLNRFVLDKLDRIATTYPLDQIRRAFLTAAKNNSHSLNFVERLLAKSSEIPRSRDTF